MKRVLIVLFCLLALPLASSVGEGRLLPADVPAPLKPWTDWVLYGQEEKLNCFSSFEEPDRVRCAWPSEFSLFATEGGARFEQRWTVQHPRWVALPGDEEHWPKEVRIDEAPALVLARGGRPHLRLEKGRHTLNGVFAWQGLPESLQIPADTALVRLEVEGRAEGFPNLDEKGRLWLRSGGEAAKKEEDRLKLKVFRHISDAIPMRVSVRIEMEVSGSAREVLLGPVLPEAFIPLSLGGSLPARLEEDGRIRARLRPGRHSLTLAARHRGKAASLSFLRPDELWPQEEVWSFEARPELRQVEIEGVEAVDPRQTALPAPWRDLPAYRLREGDTFVFKEVKRGDPDPGPDRLSLDRDIWLRFDGRGYSIRDSITGVKRSGWRLEANPPMVLGRVSLDGAEQFITRLQEGGRAGVELRRGQVRMIAESELPGRLSRLPATGWDHDFQSARVRLHLPAGWRLLHASGIDDLRHTWLKKWTLLDLFLVLILSLATARLYGRPLALLALCTLLLCFHEPDAPRWAWVAVLTALALRRIIPEGKLKKFAGVLCLVTLLALVVIAIPFMIVQLRHGIYPQLEKSRYSIGSTEEVRALEVSIEADEAELAEAPREAKAVARARIALGELSLEGDFLAEVPRLDRYDPKMLLQTGPGLPLWRWRQIPMSWTGPVGAGQEISLFLLGPAANLTLAVLRVLLLCLLILAVGGVRYSRASGLSLPRTSFPVLALCFALLPAPGGAGAAEIPSGEIFEELRGRLLEPAECFPRCAESPFLEARVEPGRIDFRMEVDAAERIAVPLPGMAGQWLPRRVRLGGKEVPAMFRDGEGTLWILVPKGRSAIELSGNLPERNRVQIPLPLKPRSLKIRAEGWSVGGIHDGDKVDGRLLLERVRPAVAEEGDLLLDTGIHPPFALIERSLQFGLNWKVRTKVRRLSPGGSALHFEVPLLDGESVVTEGVRVGQDGVLVSMDAGVMEFTWESNLEMSQELVLEHRQTDDWTEIWQAVIGPVWHLEYSGIPVILHQQGERWHPTWHPWPGEKVKLTLGRPEGMEGQTVTIDRSVLRVRPGKRATEVELLLDLRSSQGGRHELTLPEKAILQKVAIDGRPHPIRQEGRTLALPVVPGRQRIELLWQEDAGMEARFATGQVDLGIGSVNAHIDLRLPKDRWILLAGGPRLGPAILFWSILIVIALVSFGLGKVPLTPLKFRHWLLLGVGMSQAPLAFVLVVAAWLLVLGLRRKISPEMDKRHFNLMQIGIVLLTFLALLSLVAAISTGLLGHPDMQIAGNGSSRDLLRWYQDRSGAVLPRAWVLSVPMYCYRLLMLAWALWISLTLLRLLKWGWESFTLNGIWHRKPGKAKKGGGPKGPEKNKEEEGEEDFIFEEE